MLIMLSSVNVHVIQCKHSCYNGVNDNVMCQSSHYKTVVCYVLTFMLCINVHVTNRVTSC